MKPPEKMVQKPGQALAKLQEIRQGSYANVRHKAFGIPSWRSLLRILKRVGHSPVAIINLMLPEENSVMSTVPSHF
ncbi:hypothetical protein Tco_0975806 [Tanacetum coccineum]|uniref:Uncharacterized protein n=1 Tax=Tanacetum coccineum TaxID=301880 RepID=A0ABQ5EFG4_9ASTR